MVWKCFKIKKIFGNFEKGLIFDIVINLIEFWEILKGKLIEGKILSKIVLKILFFVFCI